MCSRPLREILGPLTTVRPSLWPLPSPTVLGDLTHSRAPAPHGFTAALAP